MSTLIEIKVPDIGDIADAEIIELAVAVGDTIEKEDTLIVLETEKATMDIPSTDSGVIKEILCKVGDSVAFESLIVILESSADKAVGASVAEETAEPAVAESQNVETITEESAEEIEVVAEAENTLGTVSNEPITIPDIGDDSGVDVIEVSVAVGDMVEKEDTLLVLETEKATMDIPSPFSGKIVEFSVVVGDKVSSGDLIGAIETMVVASSEVSDKKPVTEEALKTPTKETPEAVQPKSTAATTQVQPQKNTGIVYASPAIRRFGRELGADLSLVKGTGNKGRILKEDVQKYIKNVMSKPQGSSASSGSGLPQLPTIDFTKFGEVEVVALSKIQKISSKNLHRNWVSIPHVTQFDEADITEMEAFRKSMKAEALAEGIKLTPLVFMLKATAASLKAFPRFNASLAADGETLIMKKYCNIGVAVETPDGLVVPVVKDVDKKSIYELAADLTELSTKAREKKLGLEGMQGSCFTISSLGGIGGTAFTPIVNWPDVAILGVSRSSTKPIWNGQDFEPRLMLPLSLSYDHRVIDGAIAARFITHLSRTLGDIRRLAL